MKFSIVKNAQTKKIEPRSVTIDQLVTLIRSDYIKHVTDTYRELYRTDEAKAKAFKESSIPAFMVSGVFKTRNNTGLVEPSHMLSIDIDMKDEFKTIEERDAETDKILPILNQSKYIVLPHRSLSGGLKCLFWFDTDQEINSKLMKHVDQIAKNYFSELLKGNGYSREFKFDKVSDIARLCFIPYDPDIKDFDINAKEPYNLMTSGTQEEKTARKQGNSNHKIMSHNFTIPEEFTEYGYDELLVMIEELKVNNCIKNKIREFLHAVQGEKYNTLRNSLFTMGGFILREEAADIQEAINVVTYIFDYKIKDINNVNRARIVKLFKEGAARPFYILDFITFSEKGKVLINESKYKIFLNNCFKMDESADIYFLNDDNTLTHLPKDDRVVNAMIECMESLLPPDTFNIYYRDMKTSHLQPMKIKQFLTTHKINYLKADSKTSYFMFKNGVVAVTKHGMTIRPYDAYRDIGPIDRAHIIPHDIDLSHKDHTEFEDFLKLTCSVLNRNGTITLEEDKFAALRRCIGYLLHSFSVAVDKCVIFTEKNITLSKNSVKGGSGKSIITNAILKMYNVEKPINGKGDDKDRFFMDNLPPTVPIIAIDDIKPSFDSQLLFGMVGKKFDIRRMYVGKAQAGPVKVLVSANHSVVKKENDSLFRRIYVMELNRFFHSGNTPLMYLSKMLFDSWEDNEWNAFFNYMLQMSLEWHQNPELLEYTNFDWMRGDLQEMNVAVFDHIQSEIESSADGAWEVTAHDLHLMAKSLTGRKMYSFSDLANDIKRMMRLKLFTVEKARVGEKHQTTYVFSIPKEPSIVREIIDNERGGEESEVRNNTEDDVFELEA